MDHRSLDGRRGLFKVDVELVNNNDLTLATAGHLDPAKVRRVTVQAVVDSGADGRSAKRDRVQGVYLKLMSRESAFNAAVEPKRDSALLGAIVLEDLDFLVDCTSQRLVSRDPKYIVSEIETANMP